MAEESRSAQCAECGEQLSDPQYLATENREPCPKCGALGRKFGITLSAEVAIHTSLKIKAKHNGVKKPFVEQIQGADLQRSTGNMVQKERVIDRDNNLYREHVIDPLSGDIIHSAEEPLSLHTNHGSAKSQESKS
jgi:hypothetical protein